MGDGSGGGEGHSCVGLISIKLRSGFVEVELLRGCRSVGLLRVYKASFLEKTPGKLLLNTDNFVYNF